MSKVDGDCILIFKLLKKSIFARYENYIKRGK